MISKLKVAWQERTTRASECCRGSKRSGQLHATRTAAFSDCQGLVWVAKSRSRSPWREEVARHLVRSRAAEWPLLKVQRSVVSQDDEWQVLAAAVIGLQNLAGCSQP